MTKEDIFISIGFIDKTKPRKYDPFRRYFLRLHDEDLGKIMQYLGKKATKFDPMKEWETK